MGVEQIKCTVTFTNGSALVTGSGQSWLTDLSNGHIICKDAAAAPIYEVARAIDNNTLQMTANYAGDTETVAAVIHRSFTPIYRFPRLLAGDHYDHYDHYDNVVKQFLDHHHYRIGGQDEMSIGDGVAIATVAVSIAAVLCTMIRAKAGRDTGGHTNGNGNGNGVMKQCLAHSGIEVSIENIEKGMKRHEDLLQEIYNLLRSKDEKPLASST